MRDHNKLLEGNTGEQIQQLTAVSLEARHVQEDSTPYVIYPEGWQLQYLEVSLPDHIEQIVTLFDLESFIVYLKHFGTEATAIFAEVTEASATFLAVIDYYRDSTSPSWATNRVCFSPAFSPEAVAWRGVDGIALTQEHFLDHLRKWGFVISSLSDADMIELASELDFKIDGEFSSHIERTNGGRKLLFQEKVGQNKALPVPDKLRIKLPIFTNGNSYEIQADLLYRVRNGNLSITIELQRPYLAIRQAMQDLVDAVKSETGLALYRGALE
jgi:uncharacterized protein YfdQ (DUF2303 family)